MNNKLNAILTIDLEEVPIPLENGIDIPIDELVDASVPGIESLISLLTEQKINATVFTTTNFALRKKDIMKRIISDGNELASHGCNHYKPKPEEAIISKKILEDAFGQEIYGYRQPQMFPVDNKALSEVGYRYNSSINPTFIPGKYMHLDVPRTMFQKDGLLQVPSSVTPICRFPLFWLSLHHLPVWLYERLVLRTIKHDGYAVLYFHPWEFIDLDNPKWKVGWVTRKNSGQKMISRLRQVIEFLKKNNVEFTTMHNYIYENKCIK